MTGARSPVGVLVCLALLGLRPEGRAATPEAQGDAAGRRLQAMMIAAPKDAVLQSPFIAFRKRFAVQGAGAAQLHIFADTHYLLWINGRYLLSGPARFEPSGPEYDSLDVGPSLRSGDNEIVVLVLTGASNGKMRRHAPGLTAFLEREGRTLVATDETWRWSDRTRYRAPEVDWGNLMDRIDARAEDGDWTQPGYADDAWPRAARTDGAQWGPLTARGTPLLRDTPVPMALAGGARLPATLAAGQTLTFTLGHLVQAYTVLDIDADAGTELSLDYAGIRYVARSGRQRYVSSDSHGFAEGSIAVRSGRATIHSLALVERLYPFDVAGRFSSSDARLDKLWALCARSCQVFSEDSYVDCADRERTEWMDDDPPAFGVTRTAMAGPGDRPAYADARLFGALLRRTALTLQPDGWVKAHTCSDRFDIHAKMEDRSCDWVEGARRYYESTGDLSLVREIWPAIVRQMDYFLSRRTSRGLVLAREWVVWGNPVGYVTFEGTGLNAFVCKALGDAAYLGGVLGDGDAAARFGRDARSLADAINGVLWDEREGTYFSGYYSGDERAAAGGAAQLRLAVENDLVEPTMFSGLWALDQGIVPEGRRDRVARYVLGHRKEAGRIMTFYYLFSQLYQADTAAFDEEVLQAMRTKWAAMVDWPWRTTWEEFEGGSKAHIYGMFPGYFLSAYVLGVRLDGPAADNRLLIEPRLGDLTQAEGVVVTEHGPVPVSWNVEAGKLSFTLAVPTGVHARVRLPCEGGPAHLVLDGHPVRAKASGRYVEAEVGEGAHSGVLTFPRSTMGLRP